MPKAALARVVDPVAASDELLPAILAELRLLRADLAAGRFPATVAAGSGDAVIAALLQAIVVAVGNHLFISSDLLLRVPPPADASLHRAIVAAVGALSPRRVGKLLRRWEGVDVDGLRVVRVGVERDGIVWQVVACLRV